MPISPESRPISNTLSTPGDMKLKTQPSLSSLPFLPLQTGSIALLHKVWMFLQGSGASEAPNHKTITKTFHGIKCRGVILGYLSGTQKFSHDSFIWDPDLSSRHKGKTPVLPNSGWNMNESSTQESTWPCLPWASQCWASRQPGAGAKVSHAPKTLLTSPPEWLEGSRQSLHYSPQELPILRNLELSLCVIWFQTNFSAFSITKFFNYPNVQTRWPSHHGYALYSTISKHLL